MMDPRTGQIYENLSEKRALKRGLLVLTLEELEFLSGISLEERIEWAKERAARGSVLKRGLNRHDRRKREAENRQSDWRKK